VKQLTYDALKNRLRAKRVVIVGSAPSCLDNDGEYIDSFDEVIRVNNYKTKGIDVYRKTPYDYTKNVGSRIDYHYSFYGGSIKKSREELSGIKGHLCKCPNALCHPTEWHKQKNYVGCDFRPIYRRREPFWIAPVYMPTLNHYMKIFNMLGKHVPSTGFSCIWELVNIEPKELYITGFDFMTSGKHNVDDLWKKGNEEDPIRHMFDREYELFKQWYNDNDFIRVDKKIQQMFESDLL
jgi:hypothetical protein